MMAARLLLAMAVITTSTVGTIGTDDAAVCTKAIEKLQNGFNMLLRARTDKERHEAAEATAALFTVNGTLADPVWSPMTGREAIAAGEYAQYSAPAGCSQELNFKITESIGGNATLPSSSHETNTANSSLVYCAVTGVFNVTLVSLKTDGKACSVSAPETDTATVDLTSGLMTAATTVYDWAQFVAEYTSCASKVCKG